MPDRSGVRERLPVECDAGFALAATVPASLIVATARLPEVTASLSLGDAGLERTLHFEVVDVIVARSRPRLKPSESLLVTVPGGGMLLRGNGLPADGVRVRTNSEPRREGR